MARKKEPAAPRRWVANKLTGAVGVVLRACDPGRHRGQEVVEVCVADRGGWHHEGDVVLWALGVDAR